MLSFKEYTSLSFQNLFEQRFKNHFLKYAGKEIIYKYRFSYLEIGFLYSYGEKGVYYNAAISYFRDLIDKDKIFTDFYENFIDSLNPNKAYYQFLASFLQDQNFPLGITPRDSSLNQSQNADKKDYLQNADIALKDLFSYYLYKQMVILSGKKDDQSDSESSKIDKIKEEMVKTFVPDSIVRNSFKTNVSWNLLSNTDLNENTDNLIKSISLSGLKTYEDPEGGQSSQFNNPFTNNEIVYDYTFPEFSFIYNNHTISFKKNIYNIEENFDLITGDYQPAWKIFDGVSTLLDTTKFIKYTDLFENNGAYVEFFFKFDYDKLKEFDESLWFDGYEDESGTKVNWWERNNLYKKEYYSFREIVFLFSALDRRYGPAGVQDKKDINIEIIKELNLRFGARLIVSSPTLKKDIRIQDNPQRQITENPYPISKNKTFLYEFVSEVVKNKENNIDYYSYNNDNERFLQKIPASGYPIGEYEVSATDELTQIYNIVKEQTNYKFIDVFVVDEKIIGKYYDQVLNNLFKQQTVVNYCISNFNDGSFDIATQNDVLYLEAITGQGEFTNNQTLITEAKKIDDNIDKNLITVIDSIEVV